MPQHVALKLDDNIEDTYDDLYQRTGLFVAGAELPDEIITLLHCLLDTHRAMHAKWRQFEDVRQQDPARLGEYDTVYKRAVEAYEVLMHEFKAILPEAEFSLFHDSGIDAEDEAILRHFYDEYSSMGLSYFAHLKEYQFARSAEVVNSITDQALKAALSKALRSGSDATMHSIDALEMGLIAGAARKANLMLHFVDAPGELNDAIEIEGIGTIYVEFELEAAKKMRLDQAMEVLPVIGNEAVRNAISDALTDTDDGTLTAMGLRDIKEVCQAENIPMDIENRKGVELDFLIIADIHIPVSFADHVPETD
ncbi:MAG: hypothetical protein MRY32_00680 [Rickettsiales bacterium]|nr:hypothetical protein [Rickettsiales bacterium]